MNRRQFITALVILPSAASLPTTAPPSHFIAEVKWPAKQMRVAVNGVWQNANFTGVRDESLSVITVQLAPHVHSVDTGDIVRVELPRANQQYPLVTRVLKYGMKIKGME